MCLCPSLRPGPWDPLTYCQRCTVRRPNPAVRSLRGSAAGGGGGGLVRPAPRRWTASPKRGGPSAEAAALGELRVHTAQWGVSPSSLVEEEHTRTVARFLVGLCHACAAWARQRPEERSVLGRRQHSRLLDRFGPFRVLPAVAATGNATAVPAEGNNPRARWCEAMLRVLLTVAGSVWLHLRLGRLGGPLGTAGWTTPPILDALVATCEAYLAGTVRPSWEQRPAVVAALWPADRRTGFLGCREGGRQCIRLGHFARYVQHVVRSGEKGAADWGAAYPWAEYMTVKPSMAAAAAVVPERWLLDPSACEAMLRHGPEVPVEAGGWGRSGVAGIYESLVATGQLVPDRWTPDLETGVLLDPHTLLPEHRPLLDDEGTETVDRPRVAFAVSGEDPLGVACAVATGLMTS